MNKVVQALDPFNSREVLSPLKTTSSYQNLVWSDHSQVRQRQLRQASGEEQSSTWFLFLSASLPLFYRISFGGLQLYMPWTVTQIHLLAVISLTSVCGCLFPGFNYFHNLTIIQEGSFSVWSDWKIWSKEYLCPYCKAVLNLSTVDFLLEQVPTDSLHIRSKQDFWYQIWWYRYCGMSEW